ncbi:MAG: cobalamin biosynthesis protein CobQ [Pseudomonadota bacterium]
MTQTHLLVAGALLARPGRRRRNAAVMAGALIPDAAIFALFAWGLAAGVPQETLWRETYWSPGWQAVIAAGNSMPLYGALLCLSLLVIQPSDGRPRAEALPALFALAALIHLAGDLPLHNDDAHRHFWPLTDWRFISPLSYWDRDHHAAWIAPLEALLGIAAAIVLFRRFQARWVRAALALAIAAYLAVPAFFIVSLAA